MISFEAVSKEYNGTFALSAIDLKVKEGEFLFVVGPSGAGKTTLVKLLIREELPSSGEIFFDSLSVTKLSHNELPELRRNIGVVFQDFKLLPQRTAREHLLFVMDLVGKDAREQQDLALEILNLVDLTEKADLFPHQLSGGEKQRLAIARALAVEPKVLVADEPTGMIDPAASWKVLNLLSKVNELGTTVIVATHDAQIVDALKKRVVALNDGRIVRDQLGGSYAES
jgi:cell division transport system ATP-binding protein